MFFPLTHATVHPLSPNQKYLRTSWMLIAHAYNPSYTEAEIRRTEVQSQPGQRVCETLSQKYSTQ
jgi:hypothetical protein